MNAVAISNNDMVYLHWHVQEKIKDCLGFSVIRHEGSKAGQPLPAMVGFEAGKPGSQQAGSKFKDTNVWPVQKYAWKDVFAKRGGTYWYEIVPMVGTPEEAAHIVSCTRYPPEGRRGAAFGFAHDDYAGGDVIEKIAALNARTMVIPQIETAEGLANVERIAAVPGVDALWIGHFDLTNFMGIPAQFKHPDFLAALDRVVAACEANGKTAAFLTTDDDWVRDYAGKGFRLFGYGVDQLMLQQALGNGLRVLRSAVGPGRR